MATNPERKRFRAVAAYPPRRRDKALTSGRSCQADREELIQLFTRLAAQGKPLRPERPRSQ